MLDRQLRWRVLEVDRLNPARLLNLACHCVQDGRTYKQKSIEAPPFLRIVHPPKSQFAWAIEKRFFLWFEDVPNKVEQRVPSGTRCGKAAM